MRFTENYSERLTDETAKLINTINELPSAELSAFDKNTTMAVFVDIINGFINEGTMSDLRIKDIIEPNARLLEKCVQAGITTAAFADCHKEDAAEFKSFPPHCIENTSESEIVSELKEIGGYTLFPKNSTNGFHEEAFKEFLAEHSQTENFIVTGDCTDICVLQFCLALKTYFTQKNKNVRIVIPVNCVETYDAPFHSSDFANLAAFKLLSDSGIEFVKEIF